MWNIVEKLKQLLPKRSDEHFIRVRNVKFNKQSSVQMYARNITVLTLNTNLRRDSHLILFYSCGCMRADWPFLWVIFSFTAHAKMDNDHLLPMQWKSTNCIDLAPANSLDA